MRKSLTCVKCQSRKLWFLSTVRERGQYYQPSALGLAYERTFWGQFRALGTWEAYVCSSCGYTELYAKSLDELREDPANGIVLIDNEPEPQGPYR